MEITRECVLTDEVAAGLYSMYVSAFEFLRTQAAARHLIPPCEFATEMADQRIEKYVVWDDGIPIGLTTLTADLSAIPWVSSEYYVSRYPDEAARGALFYLGYILVDSSRRSSGALIMMTERINRRLSECQGVLGYDVCSHNDTYGIGRHARRLLASSHRIEPLDTQSYYAADFRNLR